MLTFALLEVYGDKTVDTYSVGYVEQSINSTRHQLQCGARLFHKNHGNCLGCAFVRLRWYEKRRVNLTYQSLSHARLIRRARCGFLSQPRFEQH